MARKKPHILLERTDYEALRTEQILKAEYIYAVFYNGEPFNLKVVNMASEKEIPKYKKVCFPNKGSALNLARRLNSSFNTDKFEVFRLRDEI